MIDTIKLRLNDYSLKITPDLRVQPPIYSLSDGELLTTNFYLFTDEKGNPVHGQKAIFNSKINLTIQGTNPYDIPPDFDRYNSPAFLQVSLPKFYKGDNFNQLSDNETKKTFLKLEKYLRNEAGINTNIKDAIVTRLDTFSNIKAQYDFRDYSTLFSDLQLTRKEKFEYAGTTFLYKNDSTQLCIYDKIEEACNSRNKDIKNKYLSYPHNIIRIENRFLKKRRIRELFGFNKVSDLIHGLDDLRTVHYQTINDTMFKDKPEKTMEMITSFQREKLVQFCKENYGRYWIIKSKALKSMFFDFQCGYGVEDIVDDYKPYIKSRSQLSRLRSQLKDAKSIYDSITKMNRHGKNNLELLEELKTKLKIEKNINLRKAV